jgi:AAA family ATP:ADP antiporter
LIRASSTSIFFSAFGAKSSPVAWLWAVGILTVTIFLCNKIQKYVSVQKVFGLASILTGIIFCSNLLMGGKGLSYFSFVWKEIYIVVQVHLLLAYANNYFKKEDFKLMIGFVGALGSLGGVFGGLLTSYLSARYGTHSVMWVGMVFTVVPAILFYFIRDIDTQVSHELSPLESLHPTNMRKYVGLIACLVILTQFIINIADFQFNLAFEQNITDSDTRTGYLGHIYSITNFLTFAFQFVCLPYLLPRVDEKKYHLLIPTSYLIFLMAILIFPGTGILPIASFYIYVKAADYSFFVSGKELFYHPLEHQQKYGAKYLTDMLIYRAAKGFIALVLIYIQTSLILNMMMVVFLIIWMIIVIKLFRLQKHIFH